VGTGQGPIKIQTGNALDVADTTSNVATNKAELAALAANIDGKDTYPNSVKTEHLSAADAQIHGAFRSGSIDVTSGGVTISSAADGATPSTGLYMDSAGFMLYKGGEATVTLNNATGDASFTGAVYATSGSFPGSIVTGTLNVGEGGITISGGTGGVSIVGNQIFLGNSGSPTVLLDGATGIITATKFVMTADGDSSMDMTLGSLTIGDATAVDDGGDGYTIADVATDSSAAYAAVSDLADDGTITPVEKLLAKQAWDTVVNEYSNLVTRATASGVSYAGLTTDYNALNTYLNTTLTVFSSMTTNTSVTRSTWDTYWKNYYDTASTLYASLAGDAELKADAAQSTASSAVQPGGGVVVDAQKYITRINTTSGLTISTATADSGARTNITANGIAIYHATNGLTVQADHTNGLWIKNHLDGGSLERASFVSSDGTENGYIMSHANAATGFHLYSPNSNVYVQTDGSGKGIALTTGGGDVVVTGGNIAMSSGLAVKGIHKTAAGNNKSNTTFSFYAASTSGGSPTVKHDVTFTDGLITAWAAT
jgi:hypothetical protein